MMLRIGIMCPSEIAGRRFMPALCKMKDVQYAGIGVHTLKERFGENISDKNVCNQVIENQKKKAGKFADQYGGKIFDSYQSLVSSDEIDAVYIPLPPALHFYWAGLALEYGKHVLSEKPFTLSLDQTEQLVRKAKARKLAVHENYMFIFHNQLEAVKNIINSGEIGSIRLYRISFGFPKRALPDFRYDKEPGGGALNDAGGYVIKYASQLLGPDSQIRYAQLNTDVEYNVDLYGSGALVNQDGTTAQIAFGMDNDYKCELEVWGSSGTLVTGRILTAPDGYEPVYVIRKNGKETQGKFPADDSFQKSIQYFMECIKNDRIREENYAVITKQAAMTETFRNMAARHDQRWQV